MNYLLDTCVISEFAKPKPNPVVVSWVRAADEDALFISVITLGEIKKGIIRLGDTACARYLREWFENDLKERFHNRTLYVDEAVALEWGRQSAVYEKKGYPRPTVDLLLAATAVVHSLTIATRNTSDFDTLIVPVFNPWEWDRR